MTPDAIKFLLTEIAVELQSEAVNRIDDAMKLFDDSNPAYVTKATAADILNSLSLVAQRVSDKWI